MYEKYTDIIDAHSHIPQKIAAKAVKSIGNFYGITMDCGGGTVEDLLQSGKEAGIKRFIVSSTATVKQQVRAINSFICACTKEHKELTGLITLHPDMTPKEAYGEIQFAVENGLKGIKLHPDFQQFAIDDKKMYAIYDEAQGNLPILFHTGDKRYGYSNPRRLAKVAKNFKNLKCVAAHFGGYSEWESVSCYADTDNVFFDTSSSLSFLNKEQALKIINLLGAHRFMFGTDFPMWRHKAELERFIKLELNAEQTENILHKNAKNFSV